MKIKSIKDLEPIINDIQLHLGLTGRVDFVENYRGQGLETYKLANGLVRFNHKPKNLLKREKKLFQKYISKVKSGSFDFIQDPYHVSKYRYIREWFYLYQAQHLGLKTRLMDWTMKWQIALLFAVENEKQHGKDGQFWVFICPRSHIINSENLEDIYDTHPLEINESYMINSPFYQDIEGKDFDGEKRRARQHGRFFVQPFEEGLVPLNEQPKFKPYLRKYIIDGAYKKIIKKELNDLGFSIDWAYYRYDNNINTKIKWLNDLIMHRCRLK